MLFTDWLVDRRHCDSKWHSDYKLIKDRVSVALREIPSSTELDWARDIECTWTILLLSLFFFILTWLGFIFQALFNLTS